MKAGIGLGQRYFGGDYAQGVKAATLATEGNLRQLQRLIPELQRYHTIAGALTVINRSATAGFKEAEDQAQTFSGAMKILQNNVYEARRVIGEAFAPDLLAAAKSIEHVTDAIRNMTPEQRENLVMWTKLAAGTAGAIVVLDKAGRIAVGVRGLLGVLGGAVGVSAGAMTGLAAGLALLGAAYVNFAGQGETFADRFADVWTKSKKALGDFGEAAKKEWEQDWDAIVMIYFRAHAAMFGGDADADFKNYLEGVRREQEQYRKDQEAAAAKAAAGKKKEVDDQVRLEKEKNARLRGEYNAGFLDASAITKKSNSRSFRTTKPGKTLLIRQSPRPLRAHHRRQGRPKTRLPPAIPRPLPRRAATIHRHRLRRSPRQGRFRQQRRIRHCHRREATRPLQLAHLPRRRFPRSLHRPQPPLRRPVARQQANRRHQVKTTRRTRRVSPGFARKKIQRLPGSEVSIGSGKVFRIP